MEVFYMKKYALWAGVLALMLSLSPAALADYETGTGPNAAAGYYDGMITEVILSQTPNQSEASPAPGGMAPVAENREIETYRGVSVGGRVSASDPDGGPLTFELTTEPMKGSVELASDGHFVYTPGENKRGKDYFGFRATDEQGNVSQEGTVIIQLLRQRSKVCYSDLVGEACAYSATVLAEKDVFVGEQLGSDYVFHPQQTVSRGEFLTMCMVLSEEDILSGTLSTGFMDDEQIDAWLKPYVSTALMEGHIQGLAASGGASFESSAEIRMQDACSILNSVLGITNVANLGQDRQSQAVSNLAACGIVDESAALDAPLTRAQAASMLAGALELLEQR